MLMQKPIRFALRALGVTAGFSLLALISLQPSETNKLSAAETVMLDRATRDYKLPDQIPWPKAGAGGTQTVTLLGNPSKPGLYIQMLKRPPNNWSPPHKHDHDRFITVLQGTMWIGTGTDFDKDKTVPLKPGSFLTDFAEHTHYDGSKDDGLVIEIVGIVPENHVARGAQ
jgi:quercetin dioxygenase-like cupin family protein